MHAILARTGIALVASLASMVQSCSALPDCGLAQSPGLPSWMPFLCNRLSRLPKVGAAAFQAASCATVPQCAHCLASYWRRHRAAVLVAAIATAPPTDGLTLLHAGTGVVKRSGLSYLKSEFAPTGPLNLNYKGT